MDHVLREKITNRSLRIAIIGLGYVGLPLAITFVEAGFRVSGIDVDRHRVHAAKRGESYIPIVASGTLLSLIATE